MDSRSIVSRILGKRLEDFRRTSEHIYFFSKENISKILTKNGFEVLAIHSQGHSFEIDVLVQRIGNMAPYIGVILRCLLSMAPFLRGLDIYVNPGTKMVVYARKVNTSEESIASK